MVFTDEFDDGALGPGWTLLDAFVDTAEVDGAFVLSLEPGAQGFATLFRDPLDLQGGSIHARLTQLPEAGSSAFTLAVREDSAAPLVHTLSVRPGGLLHAGSWTAPTMSVSAPLQAPLELKLDLTVPGEVTYLYKSAGWVSWHAVGTQTLAADVTAVHPWIIMGASTPTPAGADTIGLDRVQICGGTTP